MMGTNWLFDSPHKASKTVGVAVLHVWLYGHVSDGGCLVQAGGRARGDTRADMLSTFANTWYGPIVVTLCDCAKNVHLHGPRDIIVLIYLLFFRSIVLSIEACEVNLLTV